MAKESYQKQMNAFRKIKECCETVLNDGRLICQHCPFHVLKSDRTECYFEHLGGKAPREWEEDNLRKLC